MPVDGRHPAPGRRRIPWGRLCAGTLAAIAIGGLVGAFLAVRVLETTVPSAWVERLARRGVRLGWSHLDWSVDGTVSLRAARLQMPRSGLVASAEQVEVRVDLWALVRGELRLDRVMARGLEVVFDRGAPSPPVDEAGGPTRSATGRRFDAGQPTRSATGRRFDAGRLPHHIVVDGWTVELRDPGVPSVRGQGRWARAWRRGHTYDTAAALTLSFPSGLGVAVDAGEWVARGRVGLGDGQVSAELESERPDVPLLGIDLGDKGAVRVGRARVAVQLFQRTGDLVLQAVSLRIGPSDRPQAWGHLDRLAVQLDSAGAGSVSIDGGTVAMERAWIAARLGAGASGSGPAQIAAPDEADPASRGWLERAVEVTWQISDLDVLLLGDSMYESFEAHVSASWAHDLLSVRGRSPEGDLTLDAHFAPGVTWPLALTIQARDLDVGSLQRALRPPLPIPQRMPVGRVGGCIDADLWIVRNSPERSAPGLAMFELDWQQAMVDHPAVSNQPLEGWSAQAAGTVRWSAGARDVELVDGFLQRGPIAITAHGALLDRASPDEKPTRAVAAVTIGPTLELWAAMDEIDCQAAFDALPDGVLGPLRQVEIEGRLAPRIELMVPLTHAGAGQVRLVDLLRRCRVKALHTARGHRPRVILDGQPRRPADVDWLNQRFAKPVTEGVRGKAEIQVGPASGSYVSLSRLPGYVGGAAYLSEEVGFYRGGPINPALTGRAIRYNLERGRYMYGGSTITQQLVKNLFLTRDKTIARKVQEYLIASRVVQVVPKDRVLELYLNCIELGPNTYGIGRAARYYFGKPAGELTAQEAVFLAMLKPAPWRGASMKRRGHTPNMPYWRTRAGVIVRRLLETGLIDPTQAEAARPFGLAWSADGAYLPAVGTTPSSPTIADPVEPAADPPLPAPQPGPSPMPN